MRAWPLGLLLLSACGPTDTGGGGGGPSGFARGIAYVSGGDIWVADSSDFQGTAQMLTNTGVDGAPALTRDGHTVAFVRADPSGSAGISSVSSAGGSATVLVPPAMHTFGGLAWSPDGSTLDFAQDGAIWMVLSDGSGLMQMGPAGQFSSPSVANDGSLWAFDATAGAFSKIVGGQPTPGFTTPTAVRGAISPSGSALAYEDGSAHEVFVIDAPGSTPRQLTQIPGGNQGSPCWSTDGSTIFFTSDIGGETKIYSAPASAVQSSGTLVQVGSMPSFGG
ncbi:MAG: PD40 domain-containing protein [Deltaproteobacteria bacterium]|nr:PD40 domain-containing protein [Deltaproteobacteria bacterium]